MARIAGERARPIPLRGKSNRRRLTSGNIRTGCFAGCRSRSPTRDPGGTITGTVRVLPDYLSVGSDTDFVRVPLDAVSAQRVAEPFA